MREVVTSTDILLANSNHPYFLIMDWSNKIALLRIPTECILTKRLESKHTFFANVSMEMIEMSKVTSNFDQIFNHLYLENEKTCIRKKFCQ
jgi:hypothetical protein